MFLAHPAESVSDLLERTGSNIVVLRRTPDGDVLVAALPVEMVSELAERDLAEAFS